MTTRQHRVDGRRRPGGRGALRPRVLTEAALVLGVASTATVQLVPPLRFAYETPTGRAALETGTMLSALTAALLVGGRLRTRAGAGDLAVAGGLALLAAANCGFALLPWAVGGAAQTRVAWACTYAALTGAAMLSAGAILDGRLFARPRLVVLAVGTPLALATASAAFAWPGTTLGLDPKLLDLASLHLTGTPLLLAVQGVSAALFGVAATGFTAWAERSGDRFVAWMGAAMTLAALSRLNYMLVPSLYTDWVFTGDFLRLGSYVLILVGAAGEIRRLQCAAEAAVALEERRRIARDLHDGLTQELLYLAFQSRMLARDEPARLELDLLASAAERAADESRRAVRMLTAEEGIPFPALLEEEVRRAAARFGAVARVQIGPERDVEPELAEALVRVAREAVVNAGRHGRARRVDVELALAGEVRLLIADDGIGFDPRGAGGRGFGLTSMRERVEALGGELRVRSRPGRGTEIEAVVP